MHFFSIDNVSGDQNHVLLDTVIFGLGPLIHTCRRKNRKHTFHTFMKLNFLCSTLKLADKPILSFIKKLKLNHSHKVT